MDTKNRRRTWLFDARKACGKTQMEVATLAGISQTQYSAIETGTRGKRIAAQQAKAIAKAVNIDWQRFYE